MITCDGCDAFELQVHTHVLFIVYDPYLSWLGAGVLVQVAGSVGSPVQKMALALPMLYKCEWLGFWL